MEKNNKKKIIWLLAAVAILLALMAYAPKLNKNGFSVKYSGNTDNKETRVIHKGDFSIQAPQGWATSENFPGVLMMIGNTNEIVGDPAAKKAGLKSYFTVGYDSMEGRKWEEYVDNIKVEGKIAVPNLSFKPDRKIGINDREATILEAEGQQDDLKMKILVALIPDKDNGAWNIVFNMPIEKWPEYEPIFNETLNSFQAK